MTATQPPRTNGGGTGSRTPEDKGMPIAVVGMSFRGPADATNVENLWKMIVEGREGHSKIPQARWNNDAFYHPDNTRHGTINVESGHFFSEDLARFDAPFFNMSHDEAAALDPQQRLLLEGTFEALENAGIPLQKMAGSKTSCFVGSFCGDYTDMLVRDPEALPMYQCTNAGQSRAITANRLSYFFDLRGPSVTVDTACSGSLVALHLGCQSLRTGDASTAVVAGVNTILSHEFMSTMSMMKFLSPDGRCYTFDERANGYARGEGVGCLVLKPLEDAIRDHDTIQAVIRGSGSNQDGRTPGITLPSVDAQEELMRSVYEAAGLDPLETEFVEAHGTGTQAGDPIETEALSRVFGPGRSQDFPLRIGSIKPNVGHMEGASGIGGVIKAVLMLQNRTLLPNRNFRTLNPRISLGEWKQKIQLVVEPWETPGCHRVSVNSFGYGGSNAHVVLEDAPGYLSSRGLTGRFKRLVSAGEKEKAEPNGHNGAESHARSRLYTLSGFDESSCQTQMERVRKYLEPRAATNDESFLNDLAYTLNERRTGFAWKAAVLGSTAGDLIHALAHVKAIRTAKRPVISFVFTGQGAQWCGMGKELLEAYPVFSNTIDKISAHLHSLNAPFTVRDEITRNPKGSLINIALYSQPMCSAVQIALIDLLRAWGITPASVTGHSSGEIASAYAVGALTMEDAMSVAYYRGVAASQVQQSLLERSSAEDLGASRKAGAMMAVGMTKDEAQTYLDRLAKGKVAIACVNSPSSLTISGDEDAIDELKAQLDERGIFARKLAVQVAYHSHHMEAVKEIYRSSIANIRPKPRTDVIEFFSSVTGTKMGAAADGSELGPDYWVANMVGQVKFSDALHALCLETSSDQGGTRKAKSSRRRAGGAVKGTVDFVVEIGPHSALAGPIKQVLDADEKLRVGSIAYASALVRGKSAVKTLLDLGARLFTQGWPVNFAAINRPELSASSTIGVPQCLNDLPPYPWNHSRTYWAEPRISKVYRQRKHARTDLLGVPDRNASEAEPRWRTYLRAHEIPWVHDHKIQSNIVYPGAGYLAMAIEAISQRVTGNARPLTQDTHSTLSGFILRDVAIESAMVLSEDKPLEVLVSLWPQQGTASPNALSDWHEFRIASVSESNKWTQHCTGLVAAKYASESHQEKEQADESSTPCAQAQETQRLKQLITEADSQCTTVVNVAEFYAHLTTLGLEYGETFANVIEARATADICLAKVAIADTTATMPKNFEYPFVIHPSTLDSILHPVFGALCAGNTAQLRNPAIPISIKEMDLSCGLNATKPGQKLDVVAFASSRDSLLGNGHVTADIVAINNNETGGLDASLSIRGLVCHVLEAAGDGGEIGPGISEKTAPIAYAVTWEPDPDMLSEQDIARLCHDGCLDVESGNEEGLWHDMDCHSPGPQVAELNAAGEHHPSTALVNGAKLETCPELVPSGHTGSVLGVGHTERTGVIPPGYRAASRYLHLLGYKNPHQSILEINAGTESAASVILGALAKEDGQDGQVPRLESYTITDPDASTVEELSHSIPGAWQDLVTTRKFDVLADFGPQEMQGKSWDVVLLPRVSVLVTDKSKVLHAVHTLLKPGGRLIILDHLGAGGSECWSRDEWHTALQESHFPGLEHCVATSKTANTGVNGHDARYLISAKKDNTTSSLTTAGQDTVKTEVLIIADQEDKCVANISDRLRGVLGKSPLPATTILCGWTSAAQLASGRLCVVLSELTRPILPSPSPQDWETIKAVFLQSAGVIWAVRGGTMSCPDPTSALSFGFARTVRSEMRENDSKIKSIVTVDLAPAASLPSESGASLDHDARAIWQILFGQITLLSSGARIHGGEDSNAETMETEYAQRNGMLFIPRVVEDASLNKTISSYLGVHAPEEQPLHQPGRLFRAVLERTASMAAGHSARVRFVDQDQDEEMTLAFPDNFIGIDVRASGLSSLHDTQTSSQDTCSLGFDCSGVVIKVGAAVTTFAVGDRVACLAPTGSVASAYQDRWTAFQKIPANVSFARAAALPVAYCTAYHVVTHLARLTRDHDRTVVIHGAMGPCGQALVDLCRHFLGSDLALYATVDSAADKKRLVEFFGVADDRVFFGTGSLKRMTETVRRETHSQGADVVINAAAGEKLNSELLRLLWDSTASYGRFINLTASSGDAASASGASRLKLNIAGGGDDKNRTFASFHFGNFVKERRELVNLTWAAVMHLLGDKPEKEFAHLELVQFSFSDLERALQYMDSAPSSHKVVVTADPGTLIKAAPRIDLPELFQPSVSYMLVGGLGGIGRAMAIWMVEKGARHLIFVNRSGTSRREARETVYTLESTYGATVKVCGCDVSDEKQVKEMLSGLSCDPVFPPVRGVIHAAMVLRDTYLDQMTVQDYQAVVQPKFQGTWNLHTHLPHDLDFFVMLSSISGVIGNASQAAYAAGSSFIDAFAAHRNALGLPAVALDLGVIGGVGYLAERENTALAESMRRQGFHVTEPPVLFALLESAVRLPRRRRRQQQHQQRRTADGAGGKSSASTPAAQTVTGLGAWKRGQSLANYDTPLFAHMRRRFLAPPLSSTGVEGRVAEHEEKPLSQLLPGAGDLQEATRLVLQHLTHLIASRLSLPADSVEPDRAPSEYGVDSIVAVEVRKWIARDMGANVPMLEIMAAESLGLLAALVAGKSKYVKLDVAHGEEEDHGGSSR